MRLRALAVLTLGLAVLASITAPVRSEQPADKAVSDRLDKLTAEVRRLSDEVKELRQSISRERGKGRARAGVVTFADGKKKAFDMIRGVHTETEVDYEALTFLSKQYRV